MIQINDINSNHKQRFNLALDTGKTLVLDLQYKDSQQSWFFSLTYGTFQLNNQKLVCTMSLLNQFKNVLDIDMGVWSNDLIDPVFIDDFTNGRCGIVVLSIAEAEYLTSGYLLSHVE